MPGLLRPGIVASGPGSPAPGDPPYADPMASPLVLALFDGMEGGDWFRVAVAVTAAIVLLRVGAKVLGGFARPVPAPPDPGELRRVRLEYQCPICSTTVRMTMANDEMPEPPRHCMEDMELITPIEDL